MTLVRTTHHGRELDAENARLEAQPPISADRLEIGPWIGDDGSISIAISLATDGLQLLYRVPVAGLQLVLDSLLDAKAVIESHRLPAQ